MKLFTSGDFPNDPTLRRVYLFRAIAVLLFGLFLIGLVQCTGKKDKKPKKVKEEATVVEKLELPKPEKSSTVFTRSDKPVPFAVLADGAVNMIYFYDKGEEVGRLTWMDLDDDGVLELRWTGIAVDRSAKVFLDFLKQSGRICECPRPQKGGTPMLELE